MKHTLETLLPLLNTPEDLEKLRIITAEADGWKLIYNLNKTRAVWDNDLLGDEGVAPCGLPETMAINNPLPPYTTSLDAIFAAEERLGLHDSDAHGLFVKWTGFCSEFARLQPKRIWHCTFLTAAQRCIPFILTAQEIKS